MKPCNKNIKTALGLAEETIALAKQGNEDSEDNSCRILYFQLLDSAYQIKQIAETERENHIQKGSWD